VACENLVYVLARLSTKREKIAEARARTSPRASRSASVCHRTRKRYSGGIGTAERRVRLGTGPDGETLYPSDAERAEAERHGREAAEAEVARLRAEIDRLKKP
jgi:hypothetical protein